MSAKGSLSRRHFLRTMGLSMAGLAAAACAQPTPVPPEPTEAGPAATAAPTEAPAPTATLQAEPAPTEATEVWRGRPSIDVGFQGELALWDWSFEPRNKLLDQWIGEWQKLRPGVTIRREEMPESEMEAKLQTALVAGTGPDMSVVNMEWRMGFQNAGLLAPYPDSEDMFPQSWRDLLFSTPYMRAPDGKYYASSVGAMGGSLYYNKEIFAENDLSEDDIPRNWDDLRALAKKLTVYNADGEVDRAGFCVSGLDMWLWFDLVVQNGGHFYDKEVTEALWNQPEGVEAARLIHDLIHIDKVDSAKLPWFGESFCNGKAAMGYNYAWFPGWLESNCPDYLDKLGIAPLPTFSGKYTPAVGLQLDEDFMVVFASTPKEKQQLAFDFIHYVLCESDERVLEMAKGVGVPPDREDLADSPAIKGETLLEIGALVAPYSVHPGNLPMFSDHGKFLGTAFEEIRLQGRDPQEALDNAVQQANLDLEASGKEYFSTEWKYQPPSQ